MRTIIMRALPLFLLSPSCDAVSPPEEEPGPGMAVEAPRISGQVMMTATAIEEDPHARCPSARLVEVVSRDSKMRIQTHLVRNPNCGEEPSEQGFRSYTVIDVYDFEGQKIYAATSPRGALWIYDQRSAHKDPAWVIEIFDYQASPRGMATFTADEVLEQDPQALAKSLAQLEPPSALPSP